MPVPSANAGDQPRITIFSAISKNSDSSTQSLRESSTRSKTAVNWNQSNATTVKILEAFLMESMHCKYNNYIKHSLSYSKAMAKVEVTIVFEVLCLIKEMLIQPLTVQNVLIAAIVHRPYIYIYLVYLI